jgi:hypothetical protein
VAIRRPVRVDYDDAAVALQRVSYVPKELAGPLDLVIHVDEQDAVE